MFGSGAKTIGTITISERQRMDRRGLSIMIIVLISSVCAAVLGTTTLITVVLPTASGATPATAATTAVFGWCAVLGGLCNPFSLFPFLPFLPFVSRLRAGRFFLRFSRVRPGELLPFWEQFKEVIVL